MPVNSSEQNFFEEVKIFTKISNDQKLKQAAKNKLQQRQDFFLDQRPVEIILKQHLLQPIDFIQ